MGTVLPGRKDWVEYEHHLHQRHRLPDELLASDPTSWRVRTGRKGRPAVSAECLALAALLRALYHLPLRGVVGLMRSWCQLRGEPEELAPSKATLVRRLASVARLTPSPEVGAALPGLRTVAIDATGLALRGLGKWLSEKHSVPDRYLFSTLHACIDVETGVVLAWVLTEGRGAGTGDVSVGPELIRRAAEVVSIGAVLADRAYDARSCWEAAREVGAVLVCEPKSTATYGLDPDRDTALHQIGKIGPPLWKERRGYHGRSLVESAFGAFKRSFGDRLRSRTRENRVAEVAMRVRVTNRWRLMELEGLVR